LRVNQFRRFPRIEVWQGNRRLWGQHYAQATPNLPVHLNDHWLTQVEPSEQPIRLRLA
jgi:hypothetical protein